LGETGEGIRIAQIWKCEASESSVQKSQPKVFCKGSIDSEGRSHLVDFSRGLPLEQLEIDIPFDV
jgi:hypothetical protein